MKVKLHLPADWTLRFRGATHEDNKRATKRRNSKAAKREKNRAIRDE